MNSLGLQVADGRTVGSHQSPAVQLPGQEPDRLEEFLAVGGKGLVKLAGCRHQGDPVAGLHPFLHELPDGVHGALPGTVGGRGDVVDQQADEVRPAEGGTGRRSRLRFPAGCLGRRFLRFHLMPMRPDDFVGLPGETLDGKRLAVLEDGEVLDGEVGDRLAAVGDNGPDHHHVHRYPKGEFRFGTGLGRLRLLGPGRTSQAQSQQEQGRQTQALSQ